MLRQIRNYIENKDFKIVILENKINVVNYKEIIKISPKVISIDSSNKRVDIKGDNLVLEKLLDDEILILGQINTLEVTPY